MKPLGGGKEDKDEAKQGPRATRRELGRGRQWRPSLGRSAAVRATGRGGRELRLCSKSSSLNINLFFFLIEKIEESRIE